MRAFKDYESTPEYTESVKLPAGAYEVTIIYNSGIISRI